MSIHASKSTKGFYDSTVNLTIPADAVEISTEYHMILIQGQSEGKVINFDTEDGIPVLADPVIQYRTASEYSESIDELVAKVYSKWMRFEAEYYQREAAAQAFKDAGYTGDPNVWVTAFSDAAGIPINDSVDLILSQAEGLRTALTALGAIRMRKYELVGLEGVAAKDKFEELSTAIANIASSIS